MKCSDESNSRRSFVACDVSTGRNECWLRGGVHVSPSPSTGEEPRHRGTLERAFVLVDSPPLARSCHPLITSGSSLAFLSLSVYPHGPYGERRRVQDCAGGDQSIPFTSSVLPPQGHSLPSPPQPTPPHSSRSPVRWQEVRKHSWFFCRRLLPFCSAPLCAVTGIPSNQHWGQHLWISHRAAVEGCQNVPIPLSQKWGKFLVCYCCITGP